MSIIACLCIVYSFRKCTEERSREIGVLRSLGFYRRYIVAIFAMEATLLTISCAIISVFLAYATAEIVNSQGFLYQVGGLNREVQFTIGHSFETYAKTTFGLLWLAPVTASFSALSVIMRPIGLNLMKK